MSAFRQNLVRLKGKLIDLGKGLVGEGTQRITMASDAGYESFGELSNLGKDINDSVTLSNVEGYNTIAMHVTAPTGGSVVFEATFDDINWTAISLRSIAHDVITQTTDNNSDFIGSIAGATGFRVRTTSAGSANGTVMGGLMKQVSTLEGIEFGWAPHRIGYIPVNKDASFTTQQSNQAIWTPASGKTFALTDLILTFAGVNDGEITIFDNTNASGNIIYQATIDITKDTNLPVFLPFRTPHIGSAADNVMKVTTSAALTFDVILHGYEY